MKTNVILVISIRIRSVFIPSDDYPSRSQAPRVTNAIYQPNDEQMLERWKFQLTMSMSRLSTQILLLTQGLDDSFQRLAQEWCREVNLSSRSVLACVESTSNEEGGEGVFIPHLQKTSRYALFGLTGTSGTWSKLPVE